jgi:hypothetical protein
MPTSVTTLGPNYLDVSGVNASGYLDSYMSYLLVPVQATPSTTTAASAEQPKIETAPPKFHRAKPAATPGRIPVTKIFSQAKTGTDNQ